ncbi:MAG: hypothetical protein NC124_17765, partial [Clostridium sp.]|nr:hypothetical protein [Clostridium sp.]
DSDKKYQAIALVTLPLINNYTFLMNIMQEKYLSSKKYRKNVMTSGKIKLTFQGLHIIHFSCILVNRYFKGGH